MKYILFFLLVLLLGTGVSAQLNWMSSESVQLEYQKQAKPILIFIHTDWCKICKMQEKSVFANDSLSKVINEQFYAIRLNAEEQEAIPFFGRSYQGATVNKYHELATYLGESQENMSFPTLVLLNERFELLFRKAGLVTKDEFWQLINTL